MSDKFDVVVIGGGHNSLVAAAYLARAGLRVAVYERRPVLGGLAVTEQFHPGFFVDSGLHEAGMFRPQIEKDLFLKMHGCAFLPPDPVISAPLPGGRALSLYRDPARTAAALAHFSAADATRFPEYAAMMDRFAGFVANALERVPPDPSHLDATTLFPWLGVAAGFKGLGGSDMYNLLRLLPMSLEELLREWFEHEFVQGTLAAAGLTALRQGPYSGGTAFTLLYHLLGRPAGGLPATAAVQGGIGNLTAALAAAARGFGAHLETGMAVQAITIVDDRAAGVVLADGREIGAAAVVSGANPHHTLTELVDPLLLEVTVNRAVANIRFRGALAKVHLALGDIPNFAGLSTAQLSGRLQIGPTLNYLEQAYDAAKYGRFSEHPYLDIRLPTVADPSLAPAGKHVMSIQVQFTPYELRHEAWAAARERLGDIVVRTLAEYAPDLPGLIEAREVLTPVDLSQRFGLREGAFYHGEMMLDQLLFMRPIPGYGRYQAPLPGLYFCGAGAHPGGGITGLPGQLAAQVVQRQ